MNIEVEKFIGNFYFILNEVKKPNSGSKKTKESIKT
jgi:hypothetical protein